MQRIYRIHIVMFHTSTGEQKNIDNFLFLVA